MNAPIRVDLSRRDVRPARPLGILADALLAAQSDRVLVEFGANAADPEISSAYASWSNRHEQLLRTRVKAIALVVPSWWVRLQWQLFFLLSNPIVRATVHRTPAKALDWLAAA